MIYIILSFWLCQAVLWHTCVVYTTYLYWFRKITLYRVQSSEIYECEMQNCLKEQRWWWWCSDTLFLNAWRFPFFIYTFWSYWTSKRGWAGNISTRKIYTLYSYRTSPPLLNPRGWQNRNVINIGAISIYFYIHALLNSAPIQKGVAKEKSEGKYDSGVLPTHGIFVLFGAKLQCFFLQIVVKTFTLPILPF